MPIMMDVTQPQFHARAAGLLLFAFGISTTVGPMMQGLSVLLHIKFLFVTNKLITDTIVSVSFFQTWVLKKLNLNIVDIKLFLRNCKYINFI